MDRETGLFLFTCASCIVACLALAGVLYVVLYAFAPKRSRWVPLPLFYAGGSSSTSAAPAASEDGSADLAPMDHASTSSFADEDIGQLASEAVPDHGSTMDSGGWDYDIGGFYDPIGSTRNESL